MGDGNRANESYYIALMRGDPITVKRRGKNAFRPLLGICPALPPMALAHVQGFDRVWHTGHVPSSLLPQGSRHYSAALKWDPCRPWGCDLKLWTTLCRTHCCFALALTLPLHSEIWVIRQQKAHISNMNTKKCWCGQSKGINSDVHAEQCYVT